MFDRKPVGSVRSHKIAAGSCVYDRPLYRLWQFNFPAKLQAIGLLTGNDFIPLRPVGTIARFYTE